MDEIGYEDCFYGGGVSLIEWADIIAEILPKETVFVNIQKNPALGDNYRKITRGEAL